MPHFEFVSGTPDALLNPNSAGAEGNRYGFEGGRVIWHEGAFHLFTTEMVEAPKWVKTRIAHWRSEDGTQYVRLGTLFESSGDFTGNDQAAALWAPIPVYNEDENRWNLFLTAYRSKPNTEEGFFVNHAGQIWRHQSSVAGSSGLGGPYEFSDVAIQPGPDSDPWEGLQGTDTLFPYAVGGEWMAFYGSCHTQNVPCDWWGVGLCQASRLAGPWKRCSKRNPVLLDPQFVENPIVTQLDDGWFFAVYDSTIRHTFGIAVSPDGVNWNTGEELVFPKDTFPWLATMRTPLCLLPRGNDEFSIYFTGYDQTGGIEPEKPFAHEGFGCLGLMIVKRTEQAFSKS